MLLSTEYGCVTAGNAFPAIKIACNDIPSIIFTFGSCSKRWPIFSKTVKIIRADIRPDILKSKTKVQMSNRKDKREDLHLKIVLARRGCITLPFQKKSLTGGKKKQKKPHLWFDTDAFLNHTAWEGATDSKTLEHGSDRVTQTQSQQVLRREEQRGFVFLKTPKSKQKWSSRYFLLNYVREGFNWFLENCWGV